MFDDLFLALTGNTPLSWQRRLYEEWFAEGNFPTVIDLPTGLGKTMVMAIWLIVRSQCRQKVPTRLVYVVDRRTVVDQATDLARSLRDNAQRVLDIDLAISTLRGQLADNREWSRDPARPAIIIGTVDLIGSALLFSGYRSSFKRRPLEAGLLGQDSLLVLDEAHLSRPFEKLICSIGRDGPHQKDRQGGTLGQPSRVIRMSATSTDAADGSKPFTLDFDAAGNLQNADKDDQTIDARFNAKKRLAIRPAVDAAKLNNALAAEAISLAERPRPLGQRIVVFVRRPADAIDIADAIRKHGGTKISKGPYFDSVEILTGTMRGLERDKLVEKPVLQRFLDGNEKPGEKDDQPVFLVSTSAGEVGFDLNADHMVCDATTIDSLIQRLGRVNRRGKGNATIQLFVEAQKQDKDGKPKKLEGIDRAIANTVELLRSAMDGHGALDVSPNNIAALRRSEAWSKVAEGQQKSLYDLACSPEPTTVPLTDILLDAWSMTSITERMPGRPDVGPWLRGIDDELPQTSVVWRAELDLEGFADLDHDDIEEWFDAHRVLTHETLTVKTSEVALWFVNRWNAIDGERQSEIGARPVIVDRAGMEVLPLKDVVRRLQAKSSDKDVFLRGAEIIVPASFGGICRGLLNKNEPGLDRAEEMRGGEEKAELLKHRREAIDVADARGRYRELVVTTDEGDNKPEPLVPGTTKPIGQRHSRLSLRLISDDDRGLRLVSYVPCHERPESGETKQTLQQHVAAVRKRTDSIIAALGYDETHPIRRAFELAADWHDHGKNREFFQRAVGGTPADNVEQWQAQHCLEGDGAAQCLGKSGGKDRGRPVRGYRHEFGSLREFTDAFEGKLDEEVFDLAAHLIATHHGRGRPHFPKGGFDPDAEDRSDATHTDAIRRFARLQRKYGWWYLAWLENLLRCADAMASADPENRRRRRGGR